MSTLTKLASHLREGSTMQLHIKRTATQIEVTFIPGLANLDQDESDEVIAAYQAAVVRPLFIAVANDANVDEALQNAAETVGQAHGAGVDTLAAYRESVAAALKAAADKAAEKKTKADAKKPSPAAKTANTGKGKDKQLPAPTSKSTASQADASVPVADLFSSAASTAPPPTEDDAEGDHATPGVDDDGHEEEERETEEETPE